MTYASKKELIEVGRKTRGIVVCPRSNATLAEGFPDVHLMQKTGCRLGIGTDNIMVNSPDLFREMDFLWKASQAINKVPILPKSILKMATVNASKILKKNIGKIEEGMLADGIFIEKHSIDLEPMHNPHTSVVHRVSESHIRAVMIGGKIVHGKI
jgi:cytosine/adenosine deaminase-related metal-dependent hydrolase